MARNAIGRSTARWKELTRVLRDSTDPICHLCKRPIDLSLPAGHKESWTADHIIPLIDGGAAEDLANMAPAHMECNSRKGAYSRINKVTVSRQW